MNYKVKGIIKSISDVKELDNGAKVLDYIVEHTETSANGKDWVTPFKINMYKSGEYAEHVDKFNQYNKVGDEVEVEFSIRGQIYQGKTYNSLSHWKCEKATGNSIPNDTPPAPQEDDGDLPF